MEGHFYRELCKAHNHIFDQIKRL